MREKTKAAVKTSEAAPAVDLSAPPEEYGPAIPLQTVTANFNIDCVGPCKNQQTVRHRTGGVSGRVAYRIDLLPKMGLVRIYSFASFNVEHGETPEAYVSLGSVRQLKLLRDPAWLRARLDWFIAMTSDPAPAAAPPTDEDDALIEPEED